MPKSLQFLLYIFGVTIKIPSQLGKSKRLLKPIIDDIESKKGKIISKVKNKTKSFSVLLPITVYEPYSRLTGINKEKNDELSLFISALTCPYDYYIDNISDLKLIQQLTNIMNDPYNFDCSDPMVEFIRRLYIEIIERVESHREKDYLDILAELHNAQMRSLNQQKNNVTPEQLMYISKEKGGLSMLAYTGFVKEQTPEEIEALKSLGTWMQLVDDYSDIERDVKKSIRTYFTESSPAMQKKILDSNLTNAIVATKKINLNLSKVNRYLFEIISFAILGKTFYEQLRMGNKLVKWAHSKGPLSAIFVLLLGSLYSIKNIRENPAFLDLKF